MAALDRILDGVKEVLRMSDELQRVAKGVKELAVEVRELDKRMVRIETMVEVAKTRAASSPPRRISRDRS